MSKENQEIYPEEVAEVSQYPIPPAFSEAFPEGFSPKTIPMRITVVDQIIGEINRELIARILNRSRWINEMNS
ncbi:hypothetical protein HYU45_01875 [Candidatus Daviesbacteria bacterium]|nr:hypothetical protein [Candidatus Daviesbacteria bacterium]